MAATKGTDEIDFGSDPTDTATMTVTTGVSGLVAGSYIEAFIMHGDSTANNTADDHEYFATIARLSCKYVSATSFELKIHVEGLITGLVKFRWVAS